MTTTQNSNKQTSIKKPTATAVNKNFHSRFDVISNKILKYRETQQKAQQDAQKSAEQRMKDLEKEQKNQPVPITQQWSENLGNFTGIRAQNNPAAQPAVRPMQPVNTMPTQTQTQSKVAFIKAIKNSLAVIDKYAAFKESWKNVKNELSPYVKQMVNNANTPFPMKTVDNSNPDVSSLSPYVQHQILSKREDKNWQKQPWINKTLSFWGPLALDMFGLGRTDTNKYFQGNIANINADPTQSIGQTKYYDTPYYQSRKPL